MSELMETVSAVNDVYTAALATGRELGERESAAKVKVLADALREIEESYRERCNFCLGMLAACEQQYIARDGGCRAGNAREALRKAGAA